MNNGERSTSLLHHLRNVPTSLTKLMGLTYLLVIIPSSFFQSAVETTVMLLLLLAPPNDSLVAAHTYIRRHYEQFITVNMGCETDSPPDAAYLPLSTTTDDTDNIFLQKIEGHDCQLPKRCRRRRRKAYLYVFAALSMIQLSLVGRSTAFITPTSISRQNLCIRCAQKVEDDTSIILKDKGIGDSSPLPASSISSRENGITINGDHSAADENEDSTANNGHIINIDNMDEKEDKSFQQFTVVNDLVGASKRILDDLDVTSSTYGSRNKSYASLAKLSKAHHSMMAKSSSMRRQRFVTGKYPLYVSVKQNPTNKWLGLAESQIYLNGTSIDKSLASHDIFNWLDEKERRELHGDYEFLSLELLAEIHVKKPGYVNILPKGGAGMSLTQSEKYDDGLFGRWKSWKSRDDMASKLDDSSQNDITKKLDGERLWVTGFSLTKQMGELHTLDVESGVMQTVNDRTRKAIKWPNEVATVPKQTSTTQPLEGNEEMEDALLVTDGFLVPGKDKGGLYIVKNPGNSMSEERICLTEIVSYGNWFYHRAIWMDLTGDGRLSILAARAKFKPNGYQEEKKGNQKLGKGQLVWLERPKPHSYCANTDTPLDKDGTVFNPFSVQNAPWKLRVLDEGPDVMFSVADLDPLDDTIEIIASQFFSKKLSLHSLKVGPEPKIVFQRTIDDRVGAAFSSLLADLDGLATSGKSPNQPTVIDSGSTVVSLNSGDACSHLLVTSHECSYVESGGDNDIPRQDYQVGPTPSYGSATTTNDQSKIDGGSLFAYRIPAGKDAWKTKPWYRSVIATGFKVDSQISNMINPGAPGFCYTFFPTREGGIGRDKKWHRPLIGISGDCAESSYILRPIEATTHGDINDRIDRSTNYALMCEIKCKSTVGSLAIGYDDLYSAEAEQQSGYAKIYVPCYEQDKVLVFSMGSGENEYIEEDGGW